MAAAADSLNVFQSVHFDETIVKSDIHTYLPYGGSSDYGLSSEIRILIQNQELITATYDSFLYLEGKIEWSQPQEEGAAAKTCNLTNNFAPFLFEEIRYELGGQKVDVCRNPGITSSLKGYVSYTSTESKGLKHLGWSPIDDGSLQVDYDKSNKEKHFAVCIPLKHIFGSMEDYRQVIVNMRQELVLIRARSDANCYIGTADDATITLTKIQWKVAHVTLSDSAKIGLYERINKDAKITMPFRQWELYELPALKQAQSDIWPIKTSTQLEKPRWVIVAFQRSGKKFSREARAANFDNINIRNLKLHLNSESYPYEAMHLDFNVNKYIMAYQNYVNFRRDYYSKDEQDALFDYLYFKSCPIFVLDCSRQNESLKHSTVDVKLEMESLEAFEAGTVAYCLILHDALVQYNPLTGEVKKL
ncbi:uncharacterized protein LOC116182399 [Photinus pyralis]|uniref:Double jelly roll-like domain-containing protein n=1 Tax=Photinus pyralis TaxID=7054 RepID=A0A1Y1MYY7_PHOPY|nr:uncharacterized protein LOC116173522 [Photinus pyralis]XP_031353574.1 uncharacterized protein LOC116178259 [Photinus pyralis]XP_031358795.1 uncharacterized protein LOC116182399 [Photinus pyralis]